MKKKCSWFTIVAMLVAIAGLAAAVVALLDRRRCALCEENDEDDGDLVEYLDDDKVEEPEEAAPEE